MKTQRIVVWDLGGTKCAVAVVVYSPSLSPQFRILQRAHVILKDCQSLAELSRKIEAACDFNMAHADAILVAGAGIFNGEELVLANGYPFKMNFAKVAKDHAWPVFTIVHDYVPVICATFLANINDFSRVIYSGKQEHFGRRVAFGLGTGLGMKDGALLPHGGMWLGSNEIGHIGVPFPPLADAMAVERHQAFMHFLRNGLCLAHNDMITFEKVLSGQGIARMYQFLLAEDTCRDPQEVGEILRSGAAPDTSSMFAWYLGLLIGTIQLAFMPAGGIWMTGGVLQKHPEITCHPSMAMGIAASPAYHNVRQHFPLSLLEGEDFIFLGGAYYTVCA